MESMKNLWIVVLMASCSITMYGADSKCSASIGGVAISVPAPSDAFAEVGAEKRGYFDLFAPANNRLVCVFIGPDELARLTGTPRNLKRYLLVESNRAVEDSGHEITSADFDQMISAIKKSLGDENFTNHITEASRDEFQQKLKSLGSSKDLSVGKPVQLGTVIEMKDAYVFAMIVPLAVSNVTTKMMVISSVLRLRGRLIFEYVYAEYVDESTFRWASKTAESWANRTLAANAK
jgi:hypothetical protein